MHRLIAVILCLSPLSLSAQIPGPVVFSELMWMGSTASSADEWVELFNRSSAEIALDGWTITRLAADGDKPMVHLKGAILPGGTYLIANFPPDDSRSRLAVQPQLVAAALSLPNTKLRLRLFDNDPEKGGRLVDTADDGVGAPMAGDPQAKCAMLRIAFDQDGSLPESWATAQESCGWDPGATEMGTPGSLSSAVQEDAKQDLADPAAETPVAPAVEPPAEMSEPPAPESVEPAIQPPDPVEEPPETPLEPERELPAPSQIQSTTWGGIKRDRTGE